MNEDTVMIYHGHVVTLRDYRKLIGYEERITVWTHFFFDLWRWAERKTYAARKREAARLMKRLGIEPASFAARTDAGVSDKVDESRGSE